MYCSLCGAESKGEAGYCIKCGATLHRGSQQALESVSPTIAVFFLLTIIVVFIAGLLVTFEEATKLFEVGAGASKVVPIAFIGALTTFGIATLLMAFLWRMTRFSRPEARPAIKQGQSDAAAPSLLTQPAATLASVTEQTTRALDPPLR